MSILSDFRLDAVERQAVEKYLNAAAREAQTETINSERLVGIEIELENFNLKATPSAYVWREVGDGSLRNNGAEYVSSPIAACDAPKALYDLLVVCLHDQCCFGPRTSSHVHVNVQDLSANQVKQIVQLYCVFEKVLFNFVGKGRAKNIYCVPLYDTSLMREFNTRRIGPITEVWSKYTGLNLIPLREKGTLEFRHMHGSNDPVKLSRWIRIILRLFDYVLDPKFSARDFDKTMQAIGPHFDFDSLFRPIFKEDAQYLEFSGWPDVKQTVGALHQAYSSNTVISNLSAQRVVESPFYRFGAK